MGVVLRSNLNWLSGRWDTTFQTCLAFREVMRRFEVAKLSISVCFNKGSASGEEMVSEFPN
jgi:hypothetical protein